MQGYVKPEHIRGPIPVNKIAAWANGNPWATVLYVNSAHRRASDNASGQDFNHPLATLAQALSNITADAREDTVIIVGPEHAETIAASTAIDKQGTTIIGLGTGDRRPTFTFATATTATLAISASGCVLKNLRFNAGIDSLLAMITITAADQLIEDCDFEHDATYQAILGVTASSCSNSVFRNNTVQMAAAGATAAFSISDTSDRVAFIGNNIVGDFSGGCIQASAAVTTNLIILHNTLKSTHANDVCIDLNASATGVIAWNAMRIATDVQVTWVDSFAGYMAENYGVNAAGETGKLIGTASV